MTTPTPIRSWTLPSDLAGFLHWSFWLKVSLLIVGSLMFLEVGDGAKFQPAQTLFALGVSFVVVSTLAWEWKVFGKPSIPANLAIHILMMIGCYCLLIRLKGEVGPKQWTILGAITSVFDWANQLLGFIPQPLFEMLTSPVTMLTFLGVCVALALNRAWAAALLIFMGSIALGTELISGGPDVKWVVAGLACVGFALRLQYSPPEHRHYWSVVHRAWDVGTSHIRGDLELKRILLKEIVERRLPLTERRCLSLVRQGLAKAHDDSDVLVCATRVVDQLVHEDGLCVVISDSGRKALVPLQSLMDHEQNDVFARVAQVPKFAVVLAITILWVLSPVDLIPDNIPIVGPLDDVGAVVATAAMIVRSKRRRLLTKSTVDQKDIFSV